MHSKVSSNPKFVSLCYVDLRQTETREIIGRAELLQEQ